MNRTVTLTEKQWTNLEFDIKTVILDENQWTKCWSKMCKDLGYVPAWNQYPAYFGCIYCDSIDEGLEIVFETKREAMEFKLKWV